MMNAAVDIVTQKSLPVRGAWIEIVVALGFFGKLIVAPCEGSVD